MCNHIVTWCTRGPKRRLRCERSDCKTLDAFYFKRNDTWTFIREATGSKPGKSRFLIFVQCSRTLIVELASSVGRSWQCTHSFGRTTQKIQVILQPGSWDILAFVGMNGAPPQTPTYRFWYNILESPVAWLSRMLSQNLISLSLFKVWRAF